MTDTYENWDRSKLPADYDVRPLTIDDASSLVEMLSASAVLDGATATQSVAELTAELAAIELGRNSLAIVIFGPNGQYELAATCWLQIAENVKTEYRIFVNGRVHPAHRGRGLGAFLIAWAEQRARDLTTSVTDGRRQVMRLDYFDRGSDAVALFARCGFRFAHAEDEMRRRLDEPIPATSTTVALGFTTWAAATAARFFTVYDEAFSTRPGSPGWNEDIWVSALTDDDEFRPDLSLLVSVDGEDVGYGITHVEGATGWIVQMGVRPEWRRKGIAGALLATLLQRYQIAGLRMAALDVNINNPDAASVYARMGFQLVRRYTSYQKMIAEQGLC